MSECWSLNLLRRDLRQGRRWTPSEQLDQSRSRREWSCTSLSISFSLIPDLSPSSSRSAQSLQC